MSYPNIPEAISLFKAEVGVSSTAIPLNLASPITPADWLQLIRTQNQPERNNDDGDQGLDDDIVGKGEACVVKEDGVFVGGVASVKQGIGLARVFRIVFRIVRLYACVSRTRPNKVTSLERKLMVMWVWGWRWRWN